MKDNLQLATFGGGCFWCLDAIFRRIRGISDVQSGYSGGTIEDPDYQTVHNSETGHAESVQIKFDPEVIDYSVLLNIFWSSHNPTTPNQDGANFGSEYRSIIFYHDDEQQKLAEKVKLEIAKLWDEPIITEIVAYQNFYPAENYHQDYYGNNTEAPYCQVVINPKLHKIIDKFKDYII